MSDCWSMEEYGTLVSRIGEPDKISAYHPGLLPTEIQPRCLPQGFEWMRMFDSREDSRASRRSADPTRDTRSLWQTEPPFRHALRLVDIGVTQTDPATVLPPPEPQPTGGWAPAGASVVHENRSHRFRRQAVELCATTELG